MKDRKIRNKVIKGLLKQGYYPDLMVIKDMEKVIARDSKSDKRDTYYILALVCDYGFYLGLRDTMFRVPLN